MERINNAIRNFGSVESFLKPEHERHVRFFSIKDSENLGRGINTRRDPSELNYALDVAGMMHHEGYGVTADTPSPLLKYLGSNGCYHTYEDVASK
jgi:hypothetical protein